MTRTTGTTRESELGGLKVVLRTKTLKQIVGSGGGIAPTVAKLIGKSGDETSNQSGLKPVNPRTDYRNFLRT